MTDLQHLANQHDRSRTAMKKAVARIGPATAVAGKFGELDVFLPRLRWESGKAPNR